MRGALDPIRLGGLAAMVGGAMWVAKDGLIMLGILDLGELLIVTELFIAVGLVGLHARLEGRGGRMGSVGGLLACVAVALSVVNAPYSLLFAHDGPRTPFPFNVTYFVGTLAVFVGLVLLGIAASRAEALPSRWKLLSLVVGLSALFPVWVLALVSLELPVVALGLAWILLGYVLWSSAPGTDGPGRGPGPSGGSWCGSRSSSPGRCWRWSPAEPDRYRATWR